MYTYIVRVCLHTYVKLCQVMISHIFYGLPTMALTYNIWSFTFGMGGRCACLCLTALSSDKEEINIAAGTSSCAVEESKTKDKFISKYLIIDIISLKLNLFSFCGQNNYNSK